MKTVLHGMPQALSLCCCLVAEMYCAAALADDGKGTFTVALENDLFGAGTDAHYTHGTEFTYASDTYQPEWFLKLASWMPFYEPNSESRFVVSLGQQIYTPSDIEQKELIENDRPYAGWLYVSVGLLTDHRQDERHVDKIELVLGQVGPDSGASSVQRFIHKVTGSDRARGWDNQLHNETTFDLQYQREWMLPLIDNRMDVVPRVAMTLGTARRDIGGGVTLRFGYGPGCDFGPPLIRPSAAGSQYFTPDQPFYWYLFGGVHGRYVEHNIFLDGNTDHSSHSVSKNSWVGEVQAGAVVGWGNVRVTLTEIVRTREFEGQDDPDEFGAIAVSYRF